MEVSTDRSVSELIKGYASEIGFDLCGIAKSRTLTEHREILIDWTNSGMNGDMAYLGENIEKRINPGILFPGAKSLIVTGLNYFSGNKQGGPGVPVISQYAYGQNYHIVIKSRLNKLLSFIRQINPEVSGKVFVDSAPILEKAWAREAGIGWPGKHSVLINPKLGTFFFLGIIIVNTELDYDIPANEDHCGTCRLCIDACPTGAINDNRTINTPLCIAYLTLESKSDIPSDLVPKLSGRAFGCDICQDACPWNSKAKPHTVPEFDLPDEVQNMSADDWKNLKRKDFKRLFNQSVIGRRSYCRFMDAINAVTG